MRVITNRSTGEMGRLIVNRFLKAGARVTLLEGAVTTTTPISGAVCLCKFYTYKELQTALNKELKRSYDVIVHAAAVSDFVLQKTFKGKLGSNDKITLELVPAKKLVLDIKKKQPNTMLVGFKLEPDITRGRIMPKVASLFEKAGCDLVVINRSDARGYQAYIMRNDRSTTPIVDSKKKLVEMLINNCCTQL